jgi:hypothetical protein
MTYKQVLLGRLLADRDLQIEAAPLDYIQLRNQVALRAWRQRFSGAGIAVAVSRQGPWLRALTRSASG